jgi:hypothetical protein
MAIDPRRLLDDAAQQRAVCRVLPRSGAAETGRLVRVERGGLILTVPSRRFTGGEDVRVWVTVNDRSWVFEASVIRTGVPVPDRSQHGLLLGFIDKFREVAHDAGEAGRLLELLPPGGAAISLLEPPARLVHLDLSQLAFTMPSSYKLVFVHSGRVRLRIGLGELGVVEGTARVRSLASEEGWLLYELGLENVDDAHLHRRILDAFGPV